VDRRNGSPSGGFGVTTSGDWLRPVVSGLVAAVIVAVLGALAGRAPEDKSGWRRIVPAPMHWTGIVLGSGLVLLMSYVRLFVGSARADAEQQMTILTWLIAAFALGTVVVAWSLAAIRRSAVRWRGATIAWRRGGRETEADLAALCDVHGNWLGHTVLRFADGKFLRLDPYARGSSELLDRAQEMLWNRHGQDDAP
jgi:small-conductance mechanosensitive channel